MSKDILKGIVENEEPVALAIIIETKGSAPRHPGSKMVVGRGGVLAGTTGGGRGEAITIEKSKELIENGGFEIIRVEMLGKDVTLDDMICGGENTLFLKKIEDKDLFKKALAIVDKGLIAYVGINIDTGEVFLVDEDKEMSESFLRAKKIRQGVFDENIFYTGFYPPEKLVILGGGYVGKALYNLATFLDFEISVYDDREIFANEERFPLAKDVRSGDFTELLETFPFDLSTYAVVMTRGHKGDYACLEAILNKPYAYLGCIGSKRKVAMMREKLIAEGFSKEKVNGIFAPIGLDIGGETPEEIGVSVLGEIIGVKHGKTYRETDRK